MSVWIGHVWVGGEVSVWTVNQWRKSHREVVFGSVIGVARPVIDWLSWIRRWSGRWSSGWTRRHRREVDRSNGFFLSLSPKAVAFWARSSRWLDRRSRWLDRSSRWQENGSELSFSLCCCAFCVSLLSFSLCCCAFCVTRKWIEVKMRV